MEFEPDHTNSRSAKVPLSVRLCGVCYQRPDDPKPALKLSPSVGSENFVVEVYELYST